MSKILDFSGGMFYNKQLNESNALGTFFHHKFKKDKSGQFNNEMIVMGHSLNNNTRVNLFYISF